jgi:hypothetical protein
VPIDKNPQGPVFFNAFRGPRLARVRAGCVGYMLHVNSKSNSD